MDGVMEFLRSLGPWSPFVVFLSATAESAGFVGMFVPGELLTIVGGAIAGLGETPLAAVMVAAVTGAITGDSIGYWLGARFGERVLDRPKLRKAKPAFDRAGRFLERHGAWSLVIARFTPMVRSLVPMAAGAAHMRYRTFLAANAVGGLAWGIGVSSLGYWAGSRWEVIEASFRQGMTLFASIVVGVSVGIATVRWIARHPNEVRLRLARLGDRPVIGRIIRLVVSSWGEPRPFLRLAPHAVVFAVFLVGLVATAAVDLSYPESRFLDWVHAQISPELGSGLVAAAEVFDVATLATLAIAVIAIAFWTRRNLAWLTGASVALAALVCLVVAGVVDREVGPVPLDWAIQGDTYPDLRAAVGAALVFALAWPWTAAWPEATRRFGIALGLATALAAVGVGAGITYPVDATAGVLVGSTSVLLTAALLDPKVRSAMRIHPQAPGSHEVAPISVPSAARPAV